MGRRWKSQCHLNGAGTSLDFAKAISIRCVALRCPGTSCGISCRPMSPRKTPKKVGKTSTLEARIETLA